MNHLKEVRKQQGVSKWKLAQETGLNWKTIHRIEMRRHLPFEKSKEKIAQALGVTVEDIFPAKEVSQIFLVSPGPGDCRKNGDSRKVCDVIGFLLDKNLRRCAGCEVRLMDGRKIVSRTLSEDDGRFVFAQIPEGVYQIVSKQIKKEIRF